MKKVICEICGKEIPTNVPNYYTLTGNKACSAECQEKISRIRNNETAEKLNIMVGK